MTLHVQERVANIILAIYFFVLSIFFALLFNAQGTFFTIFLKLTFTINKYISFFHESAL